MPSTSTSMSAQRCFTAWKLPMGCAELHAVLGVLGRHLERSLGSAEQLGRRADRAERAEERGVGGVADLRRPPDVASTSTHDSVRVRSMAGSWRGTPDRSVDQVHAVGHDHDEHVRDRRALDRPESPVSAPCRR